MTRRSGDWKVWYLWQVLIFNEAHIILSDISSNLAYIISWLFNYLNRRSPHVLFKKIILQKNKLCIFNAESSPSLEYTQNLNIAWHEFRWKLFHSINTDDKDNCVEKVSAFFPVLITAFITIPGFRGDIVSEDGIVLHAAEDTKVNGDDPAIMGYVVYP